MSSSMDCLTKCQNITIYQRVFEFSVVDIIKQLFNSLSSCIRLIRSLASRRLSAHIRLEFAECMTVNLTKPWPQFSMYARICVKARQL